MDGNEVLVVALVAIGSVAFLAIAVLWRRSIVAGPGLPLWGFLRREGITRNDAADFVNRDAMKYGEVVCTVCASREECRARLAAGGDAVPPANCPNAPLLDKFGVGVDQARA